MNHPSNLLEEDEKKLQQLLKDSDEHNSKVSSKSQTRSSAKIKL